MISSIPHQYIDRKTSRVVTESLYADKTVQIIYSSVREKFPSFYQMIISPVFSRLLGFLNFDLFIGSRSVKANKMISALNIDLSECIEPNAYFDSPRKVFERKIAYWKCRPMECDNHYILSPADAKMLFGSFKKQPLLFIKEKFFSYEDIIGKNKTKWLDEFKKGDFAIFRLTPEKYHYNHMPVSGKIIDFYEIAGSHHSCNPNAMIREVNLFSKNKRAVTIIDTDVENGTGIGLVCMVEVTALMIGEIHQCYSHQYYDAPIAIKKGLFVKKGQPKSLYLPGSSVDVLIFQENRIQFSYDIEKNIHRNDAISRFSIHFGRPLVETDVFVRSTIAHKINLEKKGKTK